MLVSGSVLVINTSTVHALGEWNIRKVHILQATTCYKIGKSRRGKSTTWYLSISAKNIMNTPVSSFLPPSLWNKNHDSWVFHIKNNVCIYIYTYIFHYISVYFPWLPNIFKCHHLEHTSNNFQFCQDFLGGSKCRNGLQISESLPGTYPGFPPGWSQMNSWPKIAVPLKVRRVKKKNISVWRSDVLYLMREWP